MIVGALILIVTFVFSFVQLRFYHLQKRKCQKYAFYRLRDEVVWAIASSDTPQEYEGTYGRINAAVGILDKLTLRSFLRSQALQLANILTEVIIEGKKPKPQTMPELNEFDERFLDLTVTTAKKNSLLLRFAMTRAGYRLFKAPIVVSAFMKFVRQHNIKFMPIPRLRAAKAFASLGELIRSHDHHDHPGGRATA